VTGAESVTLESIAWRGTHIELPKNRDIVLVYGPQLRCLNDGPITFAWWDAHAQQWRDARGANWPALDRVTHWSELPTGADP
jgi:hypothetical protein